MKKETISFLWKLFTAIIAGLGTAFGITSCMGF